MADSDPTVVARQLFQLGTVPCMPADAIFADMEGYLTDAVTPELFIGAKLCDRFEIVKYIESGAFGADSRVLRRGGGQ